MKFTRFHFSVQICLLLITLSASKVIAADVVRLTTPQSEYPLGLFLQILEDETGTLSLSDVQQRHALFHRSSSDIPNPGLSRSAYWVKFRLYNPASTAQRLLLNVHDPSLDEIEFYVTREDRILQQEKSGDSYPFYNRKVIQRNFIFELNAPSQTQLTVYLRFRSQGPLQFPLTLWQPEKLLQHISLEETWWGIYFGIMLVMSMYNFFIFLSVRDFVYLYYVVYILSIALLQISIYGFGFMYLWPELPWWQNQSSLIFLFLTVAFAGLFIRGFLETAKHIPWLDKLLQGIFLTSLLACLLSLISPRELTELSVQVFNLIIIIPAFLAGLLSWNKNVRAARFFIPGWFVLITGGGIDAAHELNFLATTWLTEYALVLASGFEVVLLSFALADRINSLQQEKAKIQASALSTQTLHLEALADANQELLRTETELLQHQEQLEELVRQRTTELENAQQHIRESEERLNFAIQGTHDGIWDWYVETGETYWSPQLYTLFGYQENEIEVNQAMSTDMIHPDDHKRATAAFTAHVKRNEAYDVELRMRLKSGEYKWFHIKGSSQRNEKNRVFRIIGLIRDISQRKLEQVEREHLIEELETKNAELERFNYTVSHDLKSPLITILGFLDLLEQDVSTGDESRTEKDVKHIRNAAHTMRQLLDDLLELSRVGRVVNPPVELNFAALVDEVVNVLNKSLETKNVAIRTTNLDVLLYADRTRLKEVVQNLIENAIKFMGEQTLPIIEIGTKPSEHETVCYVKDNGIGIDLRYQEKVFGLFERLENTTEGTGVGLTLVKRIIEFHHGRVWLESAGKNQGCTFYFTIPHPTIINSDETTQ